MTKGTKKPILRVIAGRLKGRALEMVPSQETRSTKAIVRESFFNTLGIAVQDSLFIEVFAGSGSMGIEALSRGAKRALFIENSSLAYGILTKNLKNLNLSEESETYLGDSFSLLPKITTNLKSGANAIAYFDPPFSIREEMEDIYERCYALIETLTPECFFLVAIEHMSTLELPENLSGFSKVRTRKFGKSAVSYYEGRRA